MAQTLIGKIASIAQAYRNCIASNNDYAEKHLETLGDLVKRLPSGSGIDNGSIISLDKSNDSKVVIVTAFHHMDENGFYDGWTEHNIIITPAFTGINMRITGANKNDIKSYLVDLFSDALLAEV